MWEKGYRQKGKRENSVLGLGSQKIKFQKSKS